MNQEEPRWFKNAQFRLPCKMQVYAHRKSAPEPMVKGWSMRKYDSIHTEQGGREIHFIFRAPDGQSIMVGKQVTFYIELPHLLNGNTPIALNSPPKCNSPRRDFFVLE
jgi:hypothetical protein